jgi:hypothetical protein
MELKRTQRGFLHADFTDLYGESCSIQDSSLATTDAIWLGVDHVNAREMSSVVGIDPERIPARMHLSRDQVAALIPVLQRFVETGSIAEPVGQEGEGR